MTILVGTSRISSRKVTFSLKKAKNYLLKDLQSKKGFTKVSINEEFMIFVFLTTVEVEKGYFSYSEIQSEVESEKLVKNLKYLNI